ncbi:MAG: hypothetical protein IPN68_13435 [Bacteroidetes bacterium]|nr:hypothetical protein [Bacteroidota bacterium]
MKKWKTLPFDSLDVMARQIMILPDDDPSRNSNPVILNSLKTGNMLTVQNL